MWALKFGEQGDVVTAGHSNLPIWAADVWEVYHSYIEGENLYSVVHSFIVKKSFKIILTVFQRKIHLSHIYKRAIGKLQELCFTTCVQPLA